MKRLFIISLSLLWFLSGYSLRAQDKKSLYPALVEEIRAEEGPGVPIIVLKPVYSFPKKKFTSRRQQAKYEKEYARLVYNIKKVYPYAVQASIILKDIDQEYAQLKTKKEKKAYIDKMEKEAFRDFEKPLRSFTFSQGRLLVKLVDRQTNRTAYSILKEFKGGFSAFFWQSVAVIFSSSLKYEFDAEKNDRMLNELILLYEAGLL